MSSVSPSDSNLLENRGDFKLHAARRHLKNLKQLEREHGSLVSSNIRIDAEIELDEFFYHLVGVKDALLHEINHALKLRIKLREVDIDSVYTKLKQKKGVGTAAANIMTEGIRKMKFDKQKRRQHPLWVVSELNNHSKHRMMIKKRIVAIDGRITKISLIYPNTNRRMKKSAIDYLDDSYKRIERLQGIVRKKIAKYRI